MCDFIVFGVEIRGLADVGDDLERQVEDEVCPAIYRINTGSFLRW